MSYSLQFCFLNILGRGDWVAKNTNEYTKIACKLSENFEDLNFQRKKLWLDCKDSLLLDGPAYAKSMESALTVAWQDYCKD